MVKVLEVEWYPKTVIKCTLVLPLIDFQLALFSLNCLDSSGG